MNTSREIIKKLNLQPHPEGGYFSEIYRSNEIIDEHSLPERYEGNRTFSTSIYFLLGGGQKSHLHKLKSDETWHFYIGSPILIHTIDEDGAYKIYRLGNKLDEGESLQITIPRGVWFGAEVVDKSLFSLIGCTVAPGFEFTDFELGEREDLLLKFPAHAKIIELLTKG